ncbi:MAG: dihydropteroate synthase [Candidatus Margulisiibacteriota bacterium]
MANRTALTDLLNSNQSIIMGIINLTLDSFYDGGYSFDHLDKQLSEFNDHGVDIIDIGAESTRPGAQPISVDQEIEQLKKVLPIIQKSSNALISVDTYKPVTAKYALEQGVNIINDINGGESDALLALVAEYDAGIVLMHKQGTPLTMQDNPTYSNPIDEIKTFFQQQIQKAKHAGIHHIMIDPGIGFGKTLDHNLTILKKLNFFHDLNCPILIGTSNKSFIGELTGANVNERVPGSIASVISAYQKGAQIFRVHNVKETSQALKVYQALL